MKVVWATIVLVIEGIFANPQSAKLKRWADKRFVGKSFGRKNRRVGNMDICQEERAKRLRQITDNQSFYTKSGKRPIRITFTRYRSEPTNNNRLRFRLDARCSTYRQIGVLYIQVEGMFEGVNSTSRADYKISLGWPTSRLEWILGAIWNVIVMIVGLTLILSASEFPGIERILRYSFLPIVYGIYCLRLVYMFRRVKASVPEIISGWCEI